MKHDTIQTSDMAGICAAKPECVKLKVERNAEPATHDGHDQPLNPVSPALAMPPQGQDGQPTEALPLTSAGKENTVMSDESWLSQAFDSNGPPSIQIDTEKYQAYLDDPSLSKAQKEEIIQALWSIMTAFVDLGFGVHPAQEVCGKQDRALDVQRDKDSNESSPVDSLKTNFASASDDT